MNRSIALFVALAVLVAHSLAIRTDAAGNLAPPYDQAFVAYRIASHWVYEGSFSWNTGQGGFESYPSLLWVLICAVGERLYLPINLFVRVVGLFATASSFILASRFHADRAASLITPMLLAISGAMAAAAVSGTETALLTMLLTFAFLAFERGWHGTTSLALLLCGITRGEAWVLVPVFLFLRYRALRREQRGVVGPAAAPLWVFAPAVVGALLMSLLRWRMTGHALPVWVVDLAQVDAQRLVGGSAYVRDFFVSTASPLLLVYSVWFAFRGRLSHTGAHALAVFFAWAGVIVLQGGGATPFSESMVPVLPIALISAQEAMITALNSLRSAVRGLAWTSFIGAVILSSLTSLPGIEPDEEAPLAALQHAWRAPAGSPRYGFDDALGRTGLDEEARATLRLRLVGLFLRDHADPARSVLTPWPGSIGYLSNLEVRDLLGRVTAAAPHHRPRPRAILPRVDVLAALEAQPDYIVPFWRRPPRRQELEDLAVGWCRDLDDREPSQERLAAVEAALADYEQITIPLRPDGRRSSEGGSIPILRSRALGLTPRLSVVAEAGRLRVLLEHSGHEQLADLLIYGTSMDARKLCLTPTGQLSGNEAVRARANLLLSQTGERPVTLFDMPLEPRVLEFEELRVTLLNPGAELGAPGSEVAETVRVAPR